MKKGDHMIDDFNQQMENLINRYRYVLKEKEDDSFTLYETFFKVNEKYVYLKELSEQVNTLAYKVERERDTGSTSALYRIEYKVDTNYRIVVEITVKENDLNGRIGTMTNERKVCSETSLEDPRAEAKKVEAYFEKLITYIEKLEEYRLLLLTGELKWTN
jgi:hypothetical protein